MTVSILHTVSYFMQMQRELNSRRGEGSDVKDGSTSYRGMFSPQDSPCQAPRSPHPPRSPCTATPVLMPPTRSHSDSEAILEEQGATMGLKGSADNLFLDALSLDPMSGPEVPPPSRLESEKRFPCMKEVTHIRQKKENLCMCVIATSSLDFELLLTKIHLNVNFNLK